MSVKDQIFEFLLHSYYGGLTLILIGIYLLVSSFKLEAKSLGYAIHPFLYGVVSGIGFLGIGIAVVIMNYLGKW